MDTSLSLEFKICGFESLNISIVLLFICWLGIFALLTFCINGYLDMNVVYVYVSNTHIAPT